MKLMYMIKRLVTILGFCLIIGQGNFDSNKRNLMEHRNQGVTQRYKIFFKKNN